MKPHINRLRPLMTGSAMVLAFAGFLAPAVGGADDIVYTMHRPGLRVRLEVRGDKISSTRIWARQHCTDGFEGGSELSLQGPHQEIHINPAGGFDFRWTNGGGYWLRVHLKGHVYSRAITGSYTARERQGPSGVICGTGQPGDRTLRFTARR